MANSNDSLELLEIAPEISKSESLHDAESEQEPTINTQQPEGGAPNASATQHAVVDAKPSDGDSATSKGLLRRAIRFGKHTTVIDLLTICGFPLLILGAWAAIKAIQVAQWTQWKDTFEWCENHNWTYAGCASLRDNHLEIPSGSPTVKRYVAVSKTEELNESFFAGPGMTAMNIIGSTLYLFTVILFDLVRRFSKGRPAPENVKIYSSKTASDKDLDERYLLSKINSLVDELATVRAETFSAVQEQAVLRKQLIAANVDTVGSLAEMKNKLVRLQSELKKSLVDTRAEMKEVRELASSCLNDTNHIGITSALGTNHPQELQRDGQSETSTHQKGIRKRLPDIREQEHSGLLW